MEHNDQTVTILSAVILFVSGLASGAITSIITHVLNARGKKRDEAVLAYRRLMGAELPMRQAVISRYESYLYSNFHERRVRLLGNGNESWDFKEAARWMKRSEDGIGEISRKYSEIVDQCALLSLYFRKDEAIQRAVEKVLELRLDYNVATFDNISLEELDAHKEQEAVKQQNLISGEVNSPLSELIDLVHGRLSRTSLK